MAYDYDALRQIWILNGGDPQAAGIAAAVALAESGGNPNAINTSNSNGSIDRGLWQINSIHGAKSTTNITENAKAAIAISSNGKNWNPWTVYKTGAYKKYLRPGDPTLVGESVVDIQNEPTDPLSRLLGGVTEPLGNMVKAGQWFAKPENTIRIFQVVSGGGFIIAGLIILNRGLVMDAVDTVGKVVKIAKPAG